MIIEDNDKGGKNASTHYLQKQNGQNKKRYLKESSSSSQKIWESIAKNYEMIQGAQLSNSFILLMALSDVTEPLNTTQISELIAFHTKGQIYKISATLKDALEHRLKRQGYVKGTEFKNKSLYSITPKGRRLLKGWIAFLSAYQS